MKSYRIAFLLIPTILLAACGEAPTPTAEPEGQVQRYDARGRVESVAASGAEMMIFHEALPGFADAQGEVVGMPAHPMSLQVGEGVDVAQIEAGDLIAFELCVQWQPTARSWIEGVTKLPADTELDLGGEADHAAHDGHAGHDHGAHDHSHDHAGHGHDHSHHDH